jgi:hypothetical protein
LGLPDVSSPKIMPKLVTVDDVAPKLNLLGSLGNFIKSFSCYSSELQGKMFIIDAIFNSRVPMRIFT